MLTSTSAVTGETVMLMFWLFLLSASNAPFVMTGAAVSTVNVRVSRVMLPTLSYASTVSVKISFVPAGVL